MASQELTKVLATQWKRLLSTGALDASFGTGGVVPNNPSGGDDWTLPQLTSTYMYVAGTDESPGAGNETTVADREEAT